jgi:hypothetical protein
VPITFLGINLVREKQLINAWRWKSVEEQRRGFYALFSTAFSCFHEWGDWQRKSIIEEESSHGHPFSFPPFKPWTQQMDFWPTNGIDWRKPPYFTQPIWIDFKCVDRVRFWSIMVCTYATEPSMLLTRQNQKKTPENQVMKTKKTMFLQLQLISYVSTSIFEHWPHTRLMKVEGISFIRQSTLQFFSIHISSNGYGLEHK